MVKTFGAPRECEALGQLPLLRPLLLPPNRAIVFYTMVTQKYAIKV